MFAIDTNILVYAHNVDSPLNHKASAFLEQVMNQRDELDNLSVCIPAQVLLEFINVITRQSLGASLSLTDAIDLVNSYIDTGIEIIHQKETQVRTFLDLLSKINTRKNDFRCCTGCYIKG